MPLSVPSLDAPRKVSASRGLIGFRVAIALLLALALAAWWALGAPTTLQDVALLLVLAGLVIGLLLLVRRNVTVVLDAGDALVVGRKKHVVPLSEIRDVFYFSGSARRTPLITVTSPAYPGGKFSYEAIDQRWSFWAPTGAPETVLDLVARLEKITPTPGIHIEAPPRWKI